MNNFIVDQETKSVVAGSEDPYKARWNKHQDEIFAEKFDVSYVLDRNQTSTKCKVM